MRAPSVLWIVSRGRLAIGALALPLAVACADDTETGAGGDAGSPPGASGARGGEAATAGAGSVAGSTTGGKGGGAPVGGGAGSLGGSSSSGGTASAGEPDGGSVSGGASAGVGTGGHSGNGGEASGGVGGSVGAGGSGSGTAGGGASAGGDCNSVTGQKIVTVGPSGADFQSVQAALNSLPKTNTTPTQLRIAPGTYKEKLKIEVSNITLCGQVGKASSTILTFSDSALTSNGNGGTLGTTGSASTTLSGNDVSVENVTFANSTPLGGMQAVALLVNGDRVQFRGCRFLSFQDTLYVRKSRQYFRDCYVEGTVDYIFGDATAVFQNCTAHNVSGGTAVTAPNTDQAVPYGLVFLGGQLTAASSVKAGSMALGRNWGPYGAAAFLRTALGPHISAVGWVKMSDNTLDTARFSEYQSTGAGANAGSRAPQSKQLTQPQAAAYTLENVLKGWVPSYSK